MLPILFLFAFAEKKTTHAAKRGVKRGRGEKW